MSDTKFKYVLEIIRSYDIHKDVYADDYEIEQGAYVFTVEVEGESIVVSSFPVNRTIISKIIDLKDEDESSD